MTLILLSLTILISLSNKNFLHAHGGEDAIGYGNSNGYACRAKDGLMGVQGRDFKKVPLNNQECEAECTKEHWCEAVGIKKDTSHCELWYKKPPILESKNGYVCKHKLYEDFVCRTKNGGKGEKGTDYEKYKLNNEKCENKCNEEPWCEAMEYKIGFEQCELWYYPPMFESKYGSVCKLKKSDDIDSGDNDNFFPTPSPCEEGQTAGYDDANYLFWDKFYEDCENIFEFAEKASKDLLEDKFSGSIEYNKCAREGVKDSVAEWYEKCLNPAECDEYGRLAADLVINRFCQPDMDMDSRNVYEPKKIKRACKEAARRMCRGFLENTLENLVADGYLCDKKDDYYDNVDELREDCRLTVLDLMET